MTTMQPTWREERRRDRMAEAQISREAEAARAQERIAAAEARAKLQLKDRQACIADRAAMRKQRAARRADRVAWLRGHIIDLLFVPVIVVPGVLAWTAMAAYGSQVWGPAGVILPVFSEGAMWAFAGRTTIMLHRDPSRPVWHLRAGTVIFAGVGAVLNFIHGFTPFAGAVRGIGTGIVMALVSVAGVVAHQLITAGPRRSRAERSRARSERAAARRERAISRAAHRTAAAVLDADGNARLTHRARTVELGRKYGRAYLADLPDELVPAQPEPALEVHSWPRLRPAPVLPAAPQTEPAASLRTAPGEVPQTSPEQRPASASKRVTRKPPARASKPSDRRAEAERLIRGNPALSTPELMGLTGVSKATADRIRGQQPTRLHVAR